MKTKTNRTLRKILSIALCLALVMSYVPLASVMAGAVESTIPVIEGYGFDSDDSEFGDVFINPITSDTSATGTSWCDEAGKGNLIFQWGYGDTLDVTLVEPDGVVTYETSNIQPHSDDSKSSDLHWTEFPLSSTYEDGTYITATRGFDNYTNDEFSAYGTGSVANVFTQTASGDPSFLSDGMLMYGESIIENGTTSMSFDHIPATFRFIITNTHEKALSLESVTLRVVDADGSSVPAAAKYCNIEIEAENRYPKLFYGNFAYSTYDSVTTNLSDYTLEAGESYLAYALALPLGKVDNGKHDDTAFEGKTIQVEVTTSEGECIAFELAGDDIANANPSNAYNWVGGKSYTMRMETRCYDGCAFDITGKCTVCGYECTHNFDDKGFCSACGSYQPAVLNANGYYEINNAGQLYWFARLVNIEGVTDANAILTENVDLEGRIWYPIGLYNDIAEAGGESVRNQYKGNFDGNFHTVSNFTAIGTGSQGFIGYSSTSAVIKNLGVINATVSGWNAGAVMAYMGTVENCYAVDCNVTANTIANTSMVYAGAVAGTQQATVINSFAYNCEIIVGEDWAEKSSVSGIGGVTATNSYYLSETETEDGGKTAEQFESGEVAYLLQQGNTEQVWGQDNNQAGAKPMFTSNELYKVVTVGETGNYSVANVGDTNGDGTVDVTDYQAVVNKALADDHEQIETASYDDIVKYDLDGDGYLDVIDAYLLHLFINGFTTVDVYAVGDYDLNGKAFEEADIKAIKHAIENPEKLATYKKYASDINGDGKLDENDLTALTAKYGEVTGTECADNVEVYYRWGNSYTTCTATAMCTLCGKKVATETVNTTSETLSESTCTQDGKVKYTAIFENELFEEKIKTVTTDMLPHNLSDGVCTVCGIIDATNMTADELETAVTELLLVGKTNITVALAEDAEQGMFSAIRTAFSESTAADGSINLTVSGAKTVPDYGFFDIDDYYDNDDKNIAGDKLKSLTLTDVKTIEDFAFSACTYLESVNLPQVVTIGECAFNEWKKGTKLTSLNLPNATTIGDWAFAYSSLLTSVNLPKVTSIGVLAFGYCDLRTLDLPEATTIGGEAFMNNYNLVSCSAPKATTIDYYPWGSNGTSKLERLELTAVGDFTLYNNLFAYTPIEQIDLVLNKDKESQVTQNDDGTATWATTNRYGGLLTYTFKSITFVGE